MFYTVFNSNSLDRKLLPGHVYHIHLQGKFKTRLENHGHSEQEYKG